MYGLKEIEINKTRKTLNLNKIEMGTVFWYCYRETNKDVA